MKKICLLFIVTLFAFTSSAQTKRILFVGNSYTYVNDLPAIVANIANAQGDTVLYDSSAPGGFTFQQHSTNATTLAKIAQGNWDYVILQEQSQIPSFSPNQVATDCYPYAQILDSLVHAADSCTQTMFYMTWGRKNGDAANCGFYPPLCTYQGMQGRLRASYLEMAQSNQTSVAPVGVAWREIINQNPTFDLFSADESHPSVYGSYLAGCVFYAMLFHQPISSTSYTAGLNIADAQVLQQVANTVVFDSIQLWAGYGNMAHSAYTYLQNQNIITFVPNLINANNYAWDFGDGNTANIANPNHTYASNGNYQVSLTVSNNCEQQVFTDTVVIQTVSSITDNDNSQSSFIFNQNSNELLVFSQEKLSQYKIELFNVSGQLMQCDFFTQSVKINLPIGIYLYQINEINSSNKTMGKLVITSVN